MPIYEYKCRSCGTVFETLVLGTSSGIKCAGCGSTQVDKLFSVFSTSSSTAGAAPCAMGACPAQGMAGTGCSTGACPCGKDD